MTHSLLWCHFDFEIILKLHIFKVVLSHWLIFISLISPLTSLHRPSPQTTLETRHCQPTPPKANQINGGSRDVGTGGTRSNWDYCAASRDRIWHRSAARSTLVWRQAAITHCIDASGRGERASDHHHCSIGNVHKGHASTNLHGILMAPITSVSPHVPVSPTRNAVTNTAACHTSIPIDHWDSPQCHWIRASCPLYQPQTCNAAAPS